MAKTLKPLEILGFLAMANNKKQHDNELNETWKARYDAEMGKVEAQMQKILANLQKQSATDSTGTEA